MTLLVLTPSAANRNLPANADPAAPNLSDLLATYLELLGAGGLGVPPSWWS